jgi:hypothetical protein
VDFYTINLDKCSVQKKLTGIKTQDRCKAHWTKALRAEDFLFHRVISKVLFRNDTAK